MARTIPARSETPRLEDYLETIYRLIRDKGYAATVDVSDSLQVKPPTVSLMVQKLAGRGYLVHVPYRGMKLTDKGEKIAKSVISRHNTILEFLTMIGVDKRTAYRDAEGIEHYVQPTTISKIERLVEFLRKNPSYLTAMKDHVAE